MTFDNNLFAAFVYTEKGTTCADNGLQDLSTEQECSEAVTYAKYFNDDAQYAKSGSFKIYPKGCFIWDTGKMYFNLHSSGNNHPEIRSICNKGNY